MNQIKKSQLSNRERVLTVLQKKEPDRIPTFEFWVDDGVVKSLTHGGTMDDFIEKYDIDAVHFRPDEKKWRRADDTYMDEWGVTKKKGSENYLMPLDQFAPIKKIDDAERWNPPDPFAEYRFDSLKAGIKKYKSKRAIVVQIRDVWSSPRDLMGYQNFLINIIENPDLVAYLVEKCIDHSIQLAQLSAELGAEIVVCGDDIADNRSTLVSPHIFETLFLPQFKRWTKAIHDCGMYLIKHTDGNIMAVMDMLVDAGIDGIDPIDPLGKMDLGTVKETWGKQTALMGNVDCVNLLTQGTENEVLKAVKNCISIAGPGGGYICASSNSIHSGVKPTLYEVMLKTIKEFGTYPLDLDRLS
jgi:uroporphyrinogen decarboxylase